MSNALSDFTKYIAERAPPRLLLLLQRLGLCNGASSASRFQFQLPSVSRPMIGFALSYTVCCIDSTVWPSSTQYMVDCLNLMQNACYLGPGNVGFIQEPLYHQATSMGALMKHRHRLENTLLKADLDLTQTLTMTFAKDTSRSSDKRPLTQASFPGPARTPNGRKVKGYDLDTGSPPAARLVKTLTLN